MSCPKKFSITESDKELRRYLKKSSDIFYPRLRMLIISKEHEITGISKRKLATLIGVSPNSIQVWRKQYTEGGIMALLMHYKTGFKKTIFNITEQAAIKELLLQNTSSIKYKKILDALEAKFEKRYKYSTLVNFIKTRYSVSKGI